MKIFKVGVLGLRMGNNWVNGIVRHGDAQLAAVYDPDCDLAGSIAGQHGIRAAVSEDDFFARALDIVVIATPDHLHVAQSVRALALGRHVICEKPMAPSVKDCLAIIAAVRRHRRKFMVGQVCRFTPAFRAARKLISEGNIGEIAFIESEYYHDYSRVPGANNWRKDPKIRREGFIGGGCHALDLVRWLAGNPTEVFCYMNHKFLPDWPARDTGVAVMKFKSGAIGKVFVSIGVKAGYSMRTVIHGTSGSIICDNTSDHLDWFDESMREFSGRNPLRIPVNVNNHNVADEFADFVECLKSGRHPPTDEYEGTNTVALGEAALRSAETGKPARVVYAARERK